MIRCCLRSNNLNIVCQSWVFVWIINCRWAGSHWNQYGSTSVQHSVDYIRSSTMADDISRNLATLDIVDFVLSPQRSLEIIKTRKLRPKTLRQIEYCALYFHVIDWLPHNCTHRCLHHTRSWSPWLRRGMARGLGHQLQRALQSRREGVALLLRDLREWEGKCNLITVTW